MTHVAVKVNLDTETILLCLNHQQIPLTTDEAQHVLTEVKYQRERILDARSQKYALSKKRKTVSDDEDAPIKEFNYNDFEY